MIVRPRVDADLDRCVDMVEAVHQLDGYPAYLPADLRLFLASPEAYAAWVVEQAGQIVGHVALHCRTIAPAMVLASEVLREPVERLGIVARLFVAPTARRLGVGQALLDVAWREAISRDLCPVLDVATGLPGAIRLYETCGWTRAGAFTVDLPDGSSLEELVFVGPAPEVEIRPGSSSNPHPPEP
jgi:ribosomal-protein-alanine N-acetyltransferase